MKLISGLDKTTEQQRDTSSIDPKLRERDSELLSQVVGERVQEILIATNLLWRFPNRVHPLLDVKAGMSSALDHLDHA